MGDSIFNLPIDNHMNPNEHDMNLVHYLFKSDNSRDNIPEGVTPIKTKSDDSFSKQLKDVSIVVIVFILINLPQITPLFNRLVGEDNHMYALLLRTFIFVVFYVYIKAKL